MSAYNFVRSRRNFTNFFCSTPKRSYSSTPFRFCHYLHRLQRYLRSNSKVVAKRTKFWTFLSSLILRGAVPQKVAFALTPQRRGTSRAKVSSGYTPNSEVISAPLLHFKPISNSPLKKVVRGPPSTVGGALVRLGHSLARIKIWGRSTP